MDLTGLSQFVIDEVRTFAHDDNLLVGHFSRLAGVRNDAGWLYRAGGPSIIATLDRVPESTLQLVEVRVFDIALAPHLIVGYVSPWVDQYWQFYHIDMMVAGEWERRTFLAEPAQYFKLGNTTGWQPLGGRLPDGAEDLGVRQGAWNHEHCELCRANIGAGGEPDGYVSPSEHWLCGECYLRYGATRDLSFAIDF